MAALLATGATVLNNIYTENSEKYLNCKNYDVTTIAKDRATGELFVKSQIPHCQLASYFSKPLSQNRNSTSVLAEDKKHVFPKTPGNIQDIVKNKAKVQSFASEVMTFWRKNHLGGSKMGGGVFNEWDLVAIDIATIPLITDQLEKAVAALGGGFSLCMGQIISWEDLKGIHGLGTGNSKALRVPWTWVEWQIFFIFWSFKLADKDIFTWKKTPSDLPQKSTHKLTQKSTQKVMYGKNKGHKDKPKFKCTEEQKKEGYIKGVQRAMSKKRKHSGGVDKNIELALALSISEAQVKKRIFFLNNFFFIPGDKQTGSARGAESFPGP